MRGPRQVSEVWQGLDRLGFCENAILLELKDKSQGPTITSGGVAGPHPVSGHDHHRGPGAFLDDIALIASTDGGRDNVAAACLERSVHEPSALVIRVARNEGLHEDLRADLQEIIEMAKVEHAPTVRLPDQHASDFLMLRKVVGVCRGRVRKHVAGLLGEFKNGKCLDVSQCQPPPYKAGVLVTESRRDTALFGPYCGDNHAQYTRLISQRVHDLRVYCSSIEQTQAHKTLDLCEVVWIAWTLRHSSLLRRWLHTNLRFTTKPTPLASLVDDIITRIGKLSRFFRATVRIVETVKILDNIATSITVAGLKTERLRIDELRYRTEVDLRARGSVLLKGISGERLRKKLGLWDKYRVHAEIQLIVFYEQHVDIAMLSNYIGGDKLCCFLCYHFITTHAKFRANGCHQSLYSLWMVPDGISDLSPEAADRIHSALARLCGLLQEKVNQISQLPMFRSPYHPGRESCDNVSHVSCLTSLNHQQALSRWEQTLGPEQLPRHNGQHSCSDGARLESRSKDVVHAPCETRSGPTADQHHSRGQQSPVLKLTAAMDPPPQTAGARLIQGPGHKDVATTNSETWHSMMVKEPHLPINRASSASPSGAAPSSSGSSSNNNNNIIVIRSSDISVSHLPGPIIGRQARLPNDLSGQQSPRHADAMGGHESRACHVPIAHHVRASCAIGSSRKFDFHELELFFDFEPPATTTVVVLPDQPSPVSPCRMVEVTKLAPGTELTIDFGKDIVDDRIVFLSIRNEAKDGKEGTKQQMQWVKLVWQNVSHEV